MNDFTRIENMFAKHAPLFLRVGGEPEKKDTRIKPTYHPPCAPATIRKMRHMRAEGFVIGDIARTCGVSWRTAWKHTKQTSLKT